MAGIKILLTDNTEKVFQLYSQYFPRLETENGDQRSPTREDCSRAKNGDHFLAGAGLQYSYDKQTFWQKAVTLLGLEKKYIVTQDISDILQFKQPFVLEKDKVPASLLEAHSWLKSYCQQKKTRYFGSHYLPKEMVDHRFFICSLISKQLQQIPQLEATAAINKINQLIGFICDIKDDHSLTYTTSNSTRYYSLYDTLDVVKTHLDNELHARMQAQQNNRLPNNIIEINRLFPIMLNYIGLRFMQYFVHHRISEEFYNVFYKLNYYSLHFPLSNHKIFNSINKNYKKLIQYIIPPAPYLMDITFLLSNKWIQYDDNKKCTFNLLNVSYDLSSLSMYSHKKILRNIYFQDGVKKCFYDCLCFRDNLIKEFFSWQKLQESILIGGTKNPEVLNQLTLHVTSLQEVLDDFYKKINALETSMEAHINNHNNPALQYNKNIKDKQYFDDFLLTVSNMKSTLSIIKDTLDKKKDELAKNIPSSVSKKHLSLIWVQSIRRVLKDTQEPNRQFFYARLIRNAIKIFKNPIIKNKFYSTVNNHINQCLKKINELSDNDIDQIDNLINELIVYIKDAAKHNSSNLNLKENDFVNWVGGHIDQEEVISQQSNTITCLNNASTSIADQSTNNKQNNKQQNTNCFLKHTASFNRHTDKKRIEKYIENRRATNHTEQNRTARCV